jgi:hypothetical protein
VRRAHAINAQGVCAATPSAPRAPSSSSSLAAAGQAAAAQRASLQRAPHLLHDEPRGRRRRAAHEQLDDAPLAARDELAAGQALAAQHHLRASRVACGVLWRVLWC